MVSHDHEKADNNVSHGKKHFLRSTLLLPIILIPILLPTALNDGLLYLESFLPFELRNHDIVPSPLAQAIPPTALRIGITFSVWLALAGGRYVDASPFCVAYVIPVLVYISAQNGAFHILALLIHILIPFLEILCGTDKSNPTKEEERELNGKWSFRLVTMIWVPVQLVFVAWGCYAASVWNLSWIHTALFIHSIGATTGVLGINIAHELIHKDTKLEQVLGKILLVNVWYGHFYVEHIRGHHANVATPYDPATSRKGETFYGFYPRTVIGSFKSSNHLEAERLQKLGLGFWTPQNELLQLHGLSLLMTIASYYFFGPKGLLMFLGQSLVAFSLLEVVNYIEHYGLQRDAVMDSNNKATGKYEAVKFVHSWNSDARVTNYFLFKLQRHSDHHARAGRRYQILRSFDESPQMPTGYGGMITLALFPPLWFAVMDRLLETEAGKPRVHSK